MHNTIKKRFVAGLMSSVLLSSISAVKANEQESLEEVRATTMSLIELLIQEGVLSKEKADALLKKVQLAREKAKAEQQAKVANSSEQGVGSAVNMTDAKSKQIRVQYVPEHIKQEMRAQIEQEVMDKLNYKAGERLALPDWLDRFEWMGDLRFRFEEDYYPTGNQLPATLASSELQNIRVNNTTNDRFRDRFRARVGTKVHVNEWMEAGVQLVSGQLNMPLSLNQDSGFVQGQFTQGMDRAYLKAHVTNWLDASVGRMANPFYYTPLIWDPDLAFDGVVAQTHNQVNSRLKLFTNAGAFPIEQIETSDTNKAVDKYLYAAQGGIEWAFNSQAQMKLGLAYYDFSNVEGRLNPSTSPGFYNATAPQYRSKGNSTFSIDANVPGGTLCSAGGSCGLASKFQLVNITGELDFTTFDPIHVMLQGDYVKNIGFNQQEILKRTGNLYKQQTTGYQSTLRVGHAAISKLHDWQVYGTYKYLERDAVLDGFTDSTFRLGGTDAKGFIVGGQYGIGTNAWLNARWVSTDSISGLPYSVDSLIVDMNARF